MTWLLAFGVDHARRDAERGIESLHGSGGSGTLGNQVAGHVDGDGTGTLVVGQLKTGGLHAEFWCPVRRRVWRVGQIEIKPGSDRFVISQFALLNHASSA